MNKAIKIIVLFIGLAIVAGLFVFLLNLDLSENTGLQIGSEQFQKEQSGSEQTRKEQAGNEQAGDFASSKKAKEEQTGGASVDKQTPGTISSQESLAKQISDTVAINSNNNEVIISYNQPAIPSDLHFSFKAEIFDENGKCIDSYLSDAGWLSDINYYNPAAKNESIKMKVTDMNNKCALIAIKVGDEAFSKSITTYQLTVNYDGSQIWNTATWNAR